MSLKRICVRKEKLKCPKIPHSPKIPVMTLISKIFADVNHQYMDIYHMKKQIENIPRSCSYLLLKTLFCFITQCTYVPYLESGLC